jgi:RNA polymerase sigma-70 factor (ECF subfamily)
VSLGSSALKTNMEAVATCSDAEFMLRVKDGDEECFAYLLSKHRGPIVYYLCRMVKNSAVAEELAQDVFLRVYRARQNYEPTAKFTTWLYEIATNVAFDSLRDGKHAT